MLKRNKKYGKKLWAFSAGHIPLISTGKEPTFNSHDKISILNTSSKTATIRLAIYYENEDAVMDYEVSVGPRSVRKIRFNDLIDPLPVPLDTPFGFVVRSNVRVIVQFSRMITAQPALAGFCLTPFYLKE